MAEANPPNASNLRLGNGGNVLRRDPAATVTLEGLRHSEMLTISTRLGRVCQKESLWDRRFESLALICGGAVIGGGIGIVPFLSTHPRGGAIAIYGIALVALLLLGCVSVFASVKVAEIKTESVVTIKEDFDSILLSYGYEATAGTVALNSGDGSPSS